MTTKEITLAENGFATEAGHITVYNYNGETREYISLSVEYLPFGVGVPANSCVDAPDSKKEGFAICRNTDSTGWEYVADHRGETVYSTATGNPVTVSQLGEYPEGTTTTAPSTLYDQWDGEKWVKDEKAEARFRLQEEEQHKALLMAFAESRIALLSRAVNKGIATDAEKEMLEQWEIYSVLLNRVDVSVGDVVYPETPE